MTRGGMLDVVLVDDDAPSAGDGPVPPGRGHAAARDRREVRGRPAPRRAGRWVAAAAALAVVAAGVVDGVADRGRADDRAARLAGVTSVPGVLDPLAGPVRTQWRAPGGTQRTVTAGGGLVVATAHVRGRLVLVATDGATGVGRWTAPLPEVATPDDLACVSLDAATRPDPAGVAGPSSATHVVCRLVTAPGLPGGWRGSASRLVVLDARTGRRVAERALASRAATLGTAGPDVLLVELQRDGHGTVQREDPVTGWVLWTFRTAAPLPDLGSGLPVPRAELRHGVVAVDGPGAWALTPAGALRAEWPAGSPTVPPDVLRPVDLTVLSDGRVAATDPTAAAEVRSPAGTVAVPGDGGGFAIPGPVLVPVVDDGSVPGVLLTVPVGAGRVVALDAASGRERWRADLRVGSDAVLVDGRLVVRSGRGVRALDARTGEVRWDAAPDVVPTGPRLLTDGDVVLVPVDGPDGRPALAALDLADGRERWRAPVPAGVLDLRAVDGRLLALTARESVALG